MQKLEPLDQKYLEQLTQNLEVANNQHEQNLKAFNLSLIQLEAARYSLSVFQTYLKEKLNTPYSE